MKRFLIVAFITFLCLGFHSESRRVFDFEDVLNEQEEAAFQALFMAHELATGNQVALVTKASFDEGQTALAFGTQFGNDLGVGQLEKDNGIVLVFSKQQRETAIAVGLGLEGVLTDSICQHIINTQMIPAFKAGKIFNGLMDGSQEIIHILEKKHE
jgi:uncharacterized protein